MSLNYCSKHAGYSAMDLPFPPCNASQPPVHLSDLYLWPFNLSHVAFNLLENEARHFNYRPGKAPLMISC